MYRYGGSISGVLCGGLCYDRVHCWYIYIRGRVLIGSWLLGALAWDYAIAGRYVSDYRLSRGCPMVGGVCHVGVRRGFWVSCFTRSPVMAYCGDEVRRWCFCRQ